MNAVGKDGHSSEVNKSVKVVTYRLEEKHIEMVRRIAASYRIPDNMSHAIRLMIEDKFNEVMATKTDGKE